MRYGGSIEKSLSGESLHSVMQLAYWKSPKMAKYYMKEWQVLCASVAGVEPPTRDWAFGLCPHEPDDRILYCLPRQIVISGLWLLV